MQPDDFDYELPDHLIARYPTERRTDSKLLVVPVDAERLIDSNVASMTEWLREGDLLVVNNTRVIAARLFARRATGGHIELLLERQLAEDRVIAQLRANRKPATGEAIEIVDSTGAAVASATLLGRDDRFFELQFDRPVESVTGAAGHMPLPPYIDRPDEALDQERYQTVYAMTPGAVAAPTAGLHFDEALLQSLKDQGVSRTSVTLHVAAGTFQPLSELQLSTGRLHKEWYEVPDQTVNAVAATRARGGRVVAVGTTAMRALESASLSGQVLPCSGDTDLFIRPGFEFQVVDGLMTNFHLPRSSLMMLVAAFAGVERIMGAYRHAVQNQYRFFSYGDAMLLWRPAGRT
ncbi:MAG: tRNA preQ1(34) S-adenosylmethionine ribosyltransferase-isomerase QueA [Pseudomonadota bacterium]